MKTLFIVVRPGKCPRIGYPIGDDLTASVREWVAANKDSQVLIVTCSHDGFPTPGTGWVQESSEYLAMADALDEIKDMPPLTAEEWKELEAHGEHERAELFNRTMNESEHPEDYDGPCMCNECLSYGV